MENKHKLCWNAGVRFLQRDNETIIVDLVVGNFIKVQSEALEYVERALSFGGEAVVKGLSDDDREPFQELMNELKEKRYIVPRINACSCASSEIAPISESMYLQSFKTAYYSASDYCNLGCPFCYANPKRRHSPYRGNTDLSKKIIDRLVRLNVQNLIMSGGEPMLRVDLYELIEYAKERVIQVVLTSNGVLIGPSEAKKLKQTGIDYIQISIESADEHAHDALRGKGSFKKCVAAVKDLKAQGFEQEQLIITATITRRNMEKLVDFSEFAESLGATPGNSFFQPVGRAFQQEQTYAGSEKGYLQYFHQLMKQQREADIRDCFNVTNRNTSSPVVPEVRSFCGMGLGTIGVKEDGQVVPCHLFFSRDDFGIGNILDDNIVAHLTGFVNGLPTVDSIDECKDCDVRYFCGNGCWASVYWQHGDFNHKSPYCDFYKRYLSAFVWNLGKDNELEAIYNALAEAVVLASNPHPPNST